MATAAEIQAQITEVEAALHKRMLGSSASEIVSPDGTSVKFTQTSTADLQAYLSKLKSDLVGASGTGKRGPVYIIP